MIFQKVRFTNFSCFMHTGVFTHLLRYVNTLVLHCPIVIRPNPQYYSVGQKISNQARPEKQKAHSSGAGFSYFVLVSSIFIDWPFG